MMDTAVVHAASPDGEVYAHPVHQYWARTINAYELVLRQRSLPSLLGESCLADALSITGFDPNTDRSFDAYLFESPGTLYAAPLIHRRDPNALKLYLHTSWRLQGPAAQNWDSWPPVLRQLGYLERTVDATVLARLLNRYVDGIITVSEMVAESLTEYFQGPVRVTRPFINPDVAESLSAVDPALDSQTLIVVGKHRDHKGIDRLVDVWPYVRETHPDASLRIVGDGHPITYERVPGVMVDGYVSSLADVFSTAAGYVHPARFDASPVSTLEALYVGLPTIVTEHTGTRSEARRLHSQFVVPGTPDGIVEGVTNYLDLDREERATVSDQAQTIGAEFVRSERESEFSSTFRDLVTTLRDTPDP